MKISQHLRAAGPLRPVRRDQRMRVDFEPGFGVGVNIDRDGKTIDPGYLRRIFPR